MAETTGRVLQLLGLLQSRRVWTGDDLAERLGVTTRSVRRDVERLRDLGYPVRASRGHGGGYQLGAGAALPPLLLDADEAVAMAVCLRLAAGGSVAGVAESAVRMLSKLDQVMPGRLRSQVSAVHEATVTLAPQAESPVRPEVLMTLARACRDHEHVEADYTDRAGATTSDGSSPTSWSPQGAAGICSPTTGTEPTGAVCGSTGWPRCAPEAPGSHRGRRRTPPRMYEKRSAPRRTDTWHECATTCRKRLWRSIFRLLQPA